MIELVLKPERGFKALQLVRIQCPIYQSNSEKENSFDEESARIFKVDQVDVALRKALDHFQVSSLTAVFSASLNFSMLTKFLQNCLPALCVGPLHWRAPICSLANRSSPHPTRLYQGNLLFSLVLKSSFFLTLLELPSRFIFFFFPESGRQTFQGSFCTTAHSRHPAHRPQVPRHSLPNGSRGAASSMLFRCTFFPSKTF